MVLAMLLMGRVRVLAGGAQITSGQPWRKGWRSREEQRGRLLTMTLSDCTYSPAAREDGEKGDGRAGAAKSGACGDAGLAEAVSGGERVVVRRRLGSG